MEPAIKKTCKSFVKNELATAVATYFAGGMQKNLEFKNFYIFDLIKNGDFGAAKTKKKSFKQRREVHIHMEGNFEPLTWLIRSHPLGEDYGNIMTNRDLRKAAREFILEVEKNNEIKKIKNDDDTKNDDKESKKIEENNEEKNSTENVDCKKDGEKSEGVDVVDYIQIKMKAARDGNDDETASTGSITDNEIDETLNDDDDDDDMASCSDNSDLREGQYEGLICFIAKNKYIVRQCVVNPDRLILDVIPNRKAFKNQFNVFLYTEDESSEI